MAWRSRGKSPKTPALLVPGTQQSASNRSIGWGRLIAEKLRRAPESVLAIAHENLEQWEQNGALLEWRDLVENGQEAVLRVLEDPGENGTRLRQGSPFAGVLSEAERAAMGAGQNSHHRRGWLN